MEHLTANATALFCLVSSVSSMPSFLLLSQVSSLAVVSPPTRLLVKVVGLWQPRQHQGLHMELRQSLLDRLLDSLYLSCKHLSLPQWPTQAMRLILPSDYRACCPKKMGDQMM